MTPGGQPADTLSALPRSLDPLPDEALPGYLLRLAHRLGLAPARVMQLTGLTGSRDSHQPARRSLMLHLDEAPAGAFARATRLTANETSQLCISSMSGRYPWAAPPATGDQRGPRSLASPWVFTSATRYCPQCLAGDGSAIQEQYGGAWRKGWRLPVIFVCQLHHRLLEQSVPVLRSAGHVRLGLADFLWPRRRPASGPVPRHAEHLPGGRPILCATRPGLHLHPTTAGHLPGADLDMLLAVQDRLLDLLRPGGLAERRATSRPARYFADRRLTSGLISAAWPATRPLFPNRVTRDGRDRLSPRAGAGAGVA